MPPKESKDNNRFYGLPNHMRGKIYDMANKQVQQEEAQKRTRELYDMEGKLPSHSVELNWNRGQWEQLGGERDEFPIEHPIYDTVFNRAGAGSHHFGALRTPIRAFPAGLFGGGNNNNNQHMPAFGAPPQQQ